MICGLFSLLNILSYCSINYFSPLLLGNVSIFVHHFILKIAKKYFIICTFLSEWGELHTSTKNVAVLLA